MRARTYSVITVVVACTAACIGGQPKETRQQSEALGNQSRDVPQSTLHEHDWTKAATGHGAAGAIPADELARMERESAPGAKLQAEAGVKSGAAR